MKKLLIIIALLLIPLTVFAAGSSVTESSWTTVSKNVVSFTWTWVGDDGNGTVPATASLSNIDGFVFLVITNPGTPAPTDDYNITLVDEDGVDVMGGKLLLRDTANSEQAIPKVGSGLGSRLVSGTLTLTITSNTDVDATGTVTVFIYNDR